MTAAILLLLTGLWVVHPWTHALAEHGHAHHHAAHGSAHAGDQIPGHGSPESSDESGSPDHCVLCTASHGADLSPCPPQVIVSGAAAALHLSEQIFLKQSLPLSESPRGPPTR